LQPAGYDCMHNCILVSNLWGKRSILVIVCDYNITLRVTVKKCNNSRYNN
jgi:hypothetical protein